MPCVNKVKTYQVPRVLLPDGSLVQATYKDELSLIHLLSTREKIEHIFPYLQSGALISIGKLCDDVFTSTFTNKYMTVEKKGELIL